MQLVPIGVTRLFALESMLPEEEERL